MSDQRAFLAPGIFQGTLKSVVRCRGVGVHTGQEIHLALYPAQPDTGIIFVRSDQEESAIKAHFENVVDTRFSTTLGNDQGVTISTVEHLMAAFAALGIDNARVEIDGPEIPILDGSALPFMRLIQEVGVRTQFYARKYLKVLQTVRVEGEAPGQYLEIAPASTFGVSVEVPLWGTQQHQIYTYRATEESFMAAIAPARTFSLLENIQRMRSAGLIKGGSLDNALVLDGERVVNPEGMRFPQECARHKILDIIGDFALVGSPFLGHIRGSSPGHTLSHRLLQTFMSTPTAWCFEKEPVASLSQVLQKSYQPVAVFASSAYN